MSDHETTIQQASDSSITGESPIDKFCISECNYDSFGHPTTRSADITQIYQPPRYFTTGAVSSLLLFILGSILYLITAVWDYQWSKEFNQLPVWLREADDDEAWMNYRMENLYWAEGTAIIADDEYVSQDDDYVFQVGGSDVWVSKSQMLYFIAAFSFLLVGIIDLFREKEAFHILMVLAGVFGVAASLFVEENSHLSNILDCLSVHFYLFEAIALLLYHFRGENDLPGKLTARLKLFADTEFIIGAILDVMLSYFFVFSNTADSNTPLMIIMVFSDVLWLHCALIYMGFFIVHSTFKLRCNARTILSEKILESLTMYEDTTVKITVDHEEDFIIS